MDDANVINPELIDLVAQLCTRIGMIMEDVTPLALNASRDSLADCVIELVDAIELMAAIGKAGEALLKQ